MTTGDRLPKGEEDLDRALGHLSEEERSKLEDVWSMIPDTTEGGPSGGEVLFPDPERVEAVWAALETHAGIGEREQASSEAGSGEPEQAAGEAGSAGDSAGDLTGDLTGRDHAAATGPAEMPVGRVRLAPARRYRNPRASSRRPRGRIGLYLVSTSLVAAALVMFMLSPVTRTAPLGEVSLVTLADGSTVELNSGASISHRRWFDREVQLQGEAFFDIESGSRSFRVVTADAEVVVFGTRFNVRAWNIDRDAGTTVFLEEGSVALRPLASSNSVTMVPGDLRRVLEGEVSVVEATAPEETALWRESAFVFRDEWVGTILDDIQRRYAVRVSAPDEVRGQRMTLVLREPSSESAILDDLAAALGVQYQEMAGGYRILP